MRRSDTLTTSILDIIEQKMLQGSRRKRTDAKRLCEELGIVLKNGKSQPQADIPEQVEKSLAVINRKAGLKTRRISSTKQPPTQPNRPGNG